MTTGIEKKKRRRKMSPQRGHGPQRMGRVEKAFQMMASHLELTPQELLEQLISEGVTQSELSEQLRCTRQAVGILGERYNCEFPGARINLDVVVRKKHGMNFPKYIRVYGQALSQADMAKDLHVSLSTIRRRLMDNGLEKRRKKKRVDK